MTVGSTGNVAGTVTNATLGVSGPLTGSISPTGAISGQVVYPGQTIPLSGQLVLGQGGAQLSGTFVQNLQGAQCSGQAVLARQ